MNWLAHVYLSDADVGFRLGNLLADIVRGPQRAAMPNAFLLGAQQHKTIDAFTDAHPVVRRSRTRISAANRRFSGVLVDVFYDYFLASQWRDYASASLDEFTTGFYAQASARTIVLPEAAQITLDRIIEHDVLGSYRKVAGVERSLRRLSMRLAARWRRPFTLERGVEDLIVHEDAFARDFAEFFPALQAHLTRFNRPASANR